MTSGSFLSSYFTIHDYSNACGKIVHPIINSPPLVDGNFKYIAKLNRRSVAPFSSPAFWVSRGGLSICHAGSVITNSSVCFLRQFRTYQTHFFYLRFREDWKPVLTINSIIYGLQYLFLVQ
jgi:ubiquitin-protein ligase